MTEKTANLEVPELLKECLLSLTEVREKIQDYFTKTKVTENVSEYTNKCDDLITEAADNVCEMIRREVINTYFYKNK